MDDACCLFVDVVRVTDDGGVEFELDEDIDDGLDMGERRIVGE